MLRKLVAQQNSRHFLGPAISRSFDSRVEEVRHVGWAFEVEIAKLYRDEKFKIAGSVLDFQSATNDRFSILLYDAFSTKATPEVWSEDFLKTFLSNTSEQFCFFSSYAALNGLNRALESTGYLIDIHRGFKNKRNATWAYRCAQ